MAEMPKLVVTNLTDTPKRVETRGFRPGEPVEVDLSLGMQMAGRDGFAVEWSDNGYRSVPFDQGLLWMSAFSATDGYAVVAEATLHAALMAGISVAVHPCWFVERGDLLPETHRLIDESIEVVYDVGICVAPPRFFVGLPTRRRVGWTMWETTDFRIGRPEWEAELGRSRLDLLLVPTPWLVEVYEQSGWLPEGCRVRCVPFAIPQAYQFIERPERETFTVATWGTLSRRKGVVEAIEAFTRAFPLDRYPDCRLWLKTKVGVLGHSIGGQPLPVDLSDPRIEVFDEMWPVSRMQGFLYEADCGLFLSYGEGFGVPARESLATGLPTVLAAHSGHEVIADDDYTWPVLTKRMFNSDDQGGLWWQPDVDAAVEALRDIYERRKAALRKAVKGARWFHEAWGPEQVARDLLEAIRE